jgi:hypothetical protein
MTATPGKIARLKKQQDPAYITVALSASLRLSIPAHHCSWRRAILSPLCAASAGVRRQQLANNRLAENHYSAK